MIAVYLGVWLLTMLGIGNPDPQFLGIPRWYWWSALVIVFLTVVNAWFVSALWPQRGEDDA